MTMKMLFGYNFGKLSIAIIPLAQAKAEKDDWQEINVADLSEATQTRHAAYKDAYKAMKAAREAFEQGLRAEAGIADHTKPAAKAAAPRQSLVAYLAAQRG